MASAGAAAFGFAEGLGFPLPWALPYPVDFVESNPYLYHYLLGGHPIFRLAFGFGLGFAFGLTLGMGRAPGSLLGVS